MTNVTRKEFKKELKKLSDADRDIIETYHKVVNKGLVDLRLYIDDLGASIDYQDGLLEQRLDDVKHLSEITIEQNRRLDEQNKRLDDQEKAIRTLAQRFRILMSRTMLVLNDLILYSSDTAKEQNDLRSKMLDHFKHLETLAKTFKATNNDLLKRDEK